MELINHWCKRGRGRSFMIVGGVDFVDVTLLENDEPRLDGHGRTIEDAARDAMSREEDPDG